MSKFLNYIIKICVVILLVMNVFYIYVAKSKKHLEDKIYQEQAADMVKFQNLEKEMKAMFENDYLYLPTELIIKDVKGNEQKLTDVLEGNTFVLWYPQHNCSLCFQNSLERFLSYARKGRKAIVLSTNLGVRDLYFFKKKYNIDVSCYVVKKCPQPYPFKEYTHPLFFNLSGDLQISNLWIHNAKFKEISEEYFKMQERYFK